MIGVDTNVLARYYVDDRADKEATRQRVAARDIVESGQPLMVCKTVLLELEWVLRGYYRFDHAQALSVFRHLLSLTHITIEDRAAVEQALAHCEGGLELADALHYASYRVCASVATFDDKKFAKRANKLRLTPRVVVPT